MAALTADRNRQRRGTVKTAYIPVAATTKIYKGALVQLDASGYASNAVAGNTRKIVGVAAEQVDNTGAAGAKSILVEFDAEFLFTASSIAQANLGGAMLVVDNDTVDETSAGSATVGALMQFVSATQGWVYVPGMTI